MFYDTPEIAAKLRKWEKYLQDYRLPTWEELPNLGLYMDQVIALLEQYLAFLPPDEGETQIVTAAAINNYVRKKIIPAPEKKKYSRVHVAYLIMIGSLKHALEISTIQKMLPMGLSEDEVRILYNDYVARHHAMAMYFIDQVRTYARDVLDIREGVQNPVENLVYGTAVITTFAKLTTEKLVKLQVPELVPGQGNPESKGK